MLKCLLTSFDFFSISHSSLMHREICVKNFTGTTAPRISKFGTNIGYDHLYRVRKNQHTYVYYSLYLFIIDFSNKILRQRFLKSYFIEDVYLLNVEIRLTRLSKIGRM